ncbi:MAG: hypothetical protein HGA22_04970 [Clostridiales bacterium]|nr:hypothetical protein [Clostridiales bacterium]
MVDPWKWKKQTEGSVKQTGGSVKQKEGSVKQTEGFDEKIERLILQTAEEVIPPEGLRENIWNTIISAGAVNGVSTEEKMETTLLERFVFESPLRAACSLSVLISGVLWAVMGKGYTAILINILGVR